MSATVRGFGIFHQGIEGQSTYVRPAKHDFGYLQSISLKDDNRPVRGDVQTEVFSQGEN